MSWEVWTMKSKTSFFDSTLLKKNVSCFAPGWALLTVFLFLCAPLTMLNRFEAYMTAIDKYDIASGILDDFFFSGILGAFGAAILYASMVFKYLHRERDAYMMHAFPMTRNCQFVTNAVSGLLFWVVPSLFIALCNMGILALNHVTGLNGVVMRGFGQMLLGYLCFYGVALFAMHLSGRTGVAVLSYGALNLMFLVVPLLILQLVDLYFKGYDYTISRGILRLSPIVELLVVQEERPRMLWIYAGVGLVLTALSWLLYRYRHAERAGDPMIYPWAKIAFRLCFTLCTTLGLGWILMSAFGSIFLPYAILGCALGWFCSTMMVERTVKVFRDKKMWLGFLACVGVLVLSVCCLVFDLLGVQHRVPKAESIQSVEIWTDGSYDELGIDRISLSKPQDVEFIRAFHTRAVEKDDPEWDEYHRLHLSYHLANGGSLRRVYTIPKSDYAALAELYRRPDICAAWFAENVPENPKSASLNCRMEWMEGVMDLSCKSTRALRDAMVADAEAGHLWIENFLTWDDDESDTMPYSMSIQTRNSDLYGSTLYVTVPETAENTLALFEINSLERLKERNISVYENQSWFYDYVIHGDRVYLYCTLSFNNKSGSVQHGRLWASLPEDVGTLVVEDQLAGYLVSEEEKTLPTDQTPVSIIDLEPGRTELQVVFMGTYAGTAQKQDRLLPELYWHPLDTEEEIKIPIQ